MLNALSKINDSKSVAAIGFDLDGTLYDESQFIAQAYLKIANDMQAIIGKPERAIFDKLYDLWILKGSSHKTLFDDALNELGCDKLTIENEIQTILKIYRSFQPNLSLKPHVTKILNACHTKTIFLVTDGHTTLQTAKIQSLNLSNWFDEDKIWISERDGEGKSKAEINLFKSPSWTWLNTQPRNQVLFFGDRDCDQTFAESHGFSFCRVKEMELL